MDHPCLTCGACCGFFRVSFHQDHTARHGGVVPDHLCAPGPSPRHVHLKGTLAAPRRCQSLSGAIGSRVACTVYEVRPHVCREFEASYESGDHHGFCDEARAAYGIPPLTSRDWAMYRAQSDESDRPS
jgi:Fe-S-cluster containining protein